MKLLWLKKNLKTKVYVGVSAGSIVMAPTIDVATIEPADRNSIGLKDLTGLGMVEFHIEPHCDTQRFEIIKQWASEQKLSVYAIDDQTGVQTIDGKVTVVSEGKWELYRS